jgi:hypothetical protein
MGANKPIEDIEATLLAATKSALDELVWWAHATMGSAHLPGFVQEGAVIDLRPV